MEAEDLTLDGNAIAGLMAELFAVEISTAEAPCAGCGAINAVGALAVYAHGMGTVVRCVACGDVVLRVAQVRGRYWLDPHGMSCLRFAANEAR
jgi:hypothetical protein